MKTFISISLAVSAATALAQNGILNLTQLPNYANQPAPAYITEDNTPGANPITDLGAKLSPIRECQALFAIVHGDPAITEARIQSAIAQFVRSIQSFDSKYDQGRAVAPNNTANFPNFTAQENNGKRLFQLRRQDGGANCAACHRAPEFDIDPDSDNNGVIGALSGGSDLTVTRSPTLRDLVKADGSSNGAFMHDASLASLLDVVNHYNAIPADNNNLDRRLRPGGQLQNLNLAESEKNDLVAFMRTLTGVAVYTDPKWSTPFNENDELTLIILPPNNTVIAYSGSGESRVANVSSAGVAGLEYACETSTDLRVWTSQSVTAAAQGQLSAAFASPASSPKQFFRFVYRVPE